MTKKLTDAQMELDLDSFLQSHSTGSDSDDEHSGAVPRRTVDDILNESDSETSSSGESPTFRHRRIPFTSPATQTEAELPSESPSKPSSVPVSDVPKPAGEGVKALDEGVSDPRISVFGRGRSGESGGSFSLGRSYSRPLQPLFGGVKVSPRPGAALAAATAASRSVPSPHAAAIKFRRANTEFVHKVELQEESVTLGRDKDDEKEGRLDDDSNDASVLADLGMKTLEKLSKLETSFLVKQETGKFNAEYAAGDKNTSEMLQTNDEVIRVAETKSEQEEGVITLEHGLNNSDSPATDALVEANGGQHSGDAELKATSSVPGVVEEQIAESLSSTNGVYVINDKSATEEAAISSIAENFNSQGSESYFDDESSVKKDGEATDIAREDAISRSTTNELIEDLLDQFHNNSTRKKSGKKSRFSKKPLELAEELEKKYASSGLNWEEGAAAQPMRLEGIRRGPPAVGYLQVDRSNAISRAISSEAFRRDHGSPQALAVHINFIAVGMSKGVILLMPCKYSAYHPDNMDAKMVILASQGEKLHRAVTSLCFNQQGDLLLAGYADGHVTVWDVLKPTAVKTITGEHVAPVVHSLFLGQDSQVTRQFKAVTGDCKGLVLLHTFSIVPLLNRVTIKTQCLLDGQRTGTVLSASPLIMEDSLVSGQGNAMVAPGSLGGMVGGVVGGEAGWKLFSEASSLVEEGVVIFVTHQTALVVRLSPTLEVYAQLPKPDGIREGSMPYTAWKCPMYTRSTSHEPIPAETSERASLLAIVWDRKVQVAKLIKSEVKVYREWNLDSVAIGVAWLDDQMLVVLTLSGQLCLFAKDGTEINRTSFIEHGSGDVITYHTYFTNIFGNPEKAYQNSVSVRGATVYVLGPNHLVVSRLFPWKERIQVLQRAGDWMGALDMAMRLYDGYAHGVIDLPRTVDAIRETIMHYLVELLLSYVDEVFSYISVAFHNQAGKDLDGQMARNSYIHSEIQDQYARVGGVAVEFCVHIKRTDILFDDIFSRFFGVQQGGTFLELLEPYVLKDMLGCLPPEIMQALVEHYSSKGWLQRVEQCVLHMDISSLDFNQVAKLCREHGLYGALIYLFNRGLDDYTTPLEELLTVLQTHGRTDGAAIGYRMLVYLKYCFMGLAFPPGHGTIPPSRLPFLRMELLQFLLEESNAMTTSIQKSCKLSTGSSANLCYLLWLDTEATLEVVKCAFADNETESSDQVNHSVDENLVENKKTNSHVMVQNIVNTIVQFLDMEISEEVVPPEKEENDSLEVWLSKKDMDHILDFISYFVTCKGATISDNVLARILEYLTSEVAPISDVMAQKSRISQRREKQVLALLKVVPQSDWDPSKLLQQCELARFYQVCALIHTIQGQYLAALDSYMKDTNEPVHAFAFINIRLMQLRDAELAAFRSAVISRIAKLVNLSREGTFFLVLDQFSGESYQVLAALQAHPKSLFLYLKTIIEAHSIGHLDFSSFEGCHDLDFTSGMIANDQTAVEAYLERLSSFSKLLSHSPVHVTDEMAELYLELLCQYDRSSVLKFLETFENYRLEHCLRLCQAYEVVDAAAFLLERAGDAASALTLTMSSISEKLEALDAALESRLSDTMLPGISQSEQFNLILKMEEVKTIYEVLHASIGLCQRNTPRLDSEESELLWFRLLDSFFDPLKDLYDGKKKIYEGRSTYHALAVSNSEKDRDDSTYKWQLSRSQKGSQTFRRLLCQFIKDVIEGMIGFVPLLRIMGKLLSDNGSHEFGDFKLTILGMLGTYDYERRILDTAKSLIEDDTFYTMSLLRKGALHAYAPLSFACCICGSILSKDASTSSIRVFNCGHATHLQCESLENGAFSQESSIGCPVCMPKKKPVQARSKSTLADHGLVLSRAQQGHGNASVQHLHEPELVEKPYGLQQMSRFEILNRLEKSARSLQIDTVPHLRLAPPAVYHEKVKKATDIIRDENNSSAGKSEKPSKMKQSRDLRTRASAIRFPLKSSIFSTGSSSRQNAAMTST